MRVSRYMQIFSLFGLSIAAIAISGGVFAPVTAADEAAEKKSVEHQDEKKEAAEKESASAKNGASTDAKDKSEKSDSLKSDTAKAEAGKPIENSGELPKQTLYYNRDIRPILAENCFSCHGPDSASRKADLRLDQREAAIEMSAIVPGKPDESGAIERIFTLDKETLMPPPESHKTLTAKQRETIRQWISEGAIYEPHWSFIAPKRPNVPKITNEKWVRNPIDAFVLRELENRKLAPANEADRRTLARRLSLDLRGIPPTPAEVEEFVNDISPNYYEAYVDRMLASPQWGEHRARYWLDYARYADTHGIHFDNYREMWSFRDWLINAFNRNQSFDQFTIDCLAGDLRPNRTIEQQVGSGFNRCHATTNEGGIIDEEYLVLYDRDRTETTSQVWLGLTMNCCVCHDHKFDPVSQKEFYQFAAFFNNTTQAARDGNIHDTPPIMKVPLEADRVAAKEISEKIKVKTAEIEQHKKDVHPKFLVWAKDAKAEQFDDTISDEGLVFHAPLNEGRKNTIHYISNGKEKSIDLKNGFDWAKGQISKSSFRVGKSGETPTFPDIGDFDSTEPFSYGCWAYVPRTKSSASLLARMDEEQDFRGWDLWLEDQKIGVHIINKWPDSTLKVVCKTSAGYKNWHHIFVTYDGSQKATGLKIYMNGVLQPVDVHNDTLNGTIKTKVPLKIGQRNKTSRADRVQINDMRIYSRVLTNSEVRMLSKANRLKEILAKEEATRTGEEIAAMKDWWLNNEDETFTQLTTEVDDLLKIQNEIDSRGTIAYVMQEKMGPAHAYVLKRGEYDQRDVKVMAGTPEALPAFPENFPKNRLGLAQWLLMPDHPLTARVTVNRIWQEIFGTGIVRTSGDFGVSGELPSHPELLDWLAVEFREGGWDMKKFYKMIVMSATYRQAALTTPEKLEKDPANTYFSRGPRFRMDGEMIRDYLLSASGLLVNKIGGPSVKPYQPDGVWDNVGMAESNTRKYKQDKGESLYRRSMYSFWKRMAPPTGLEVFNAPNREVCVTRRERTNTPLMALAALNDVQYIEAARFLAQQTLSDQGRSLDDNIEFLAKRLLCRSFKQNEVQIVKDSLGELRAYYKDHQDDAQKVIKVGEKEVDKTLPPEELAAWTMLVNEMMNLDEVLSK